MVELNPEQEDLFLDCEKEGFYEKKYGKKQEIINTKKN